MRSGCEHAACLGNRLIHMYSKMREHEGWLESVQPDSPSRALFVGLQCLVQVPCTGSSCRFRKDPYDPLIHDLRLQHFYNTGNTAAARLLLWFTGLVYSISTAISTTLETLQQHVWPSWLQWLSSWGRRIQTRQCPVNWVCRLLCWKALDHCSQNSQVIKLSTISTKKAPLTLRSSSTSKYMFLLFDMVCRCKRRKRAMMGNRWKL